MIKSWAYSYRSIISLAKPNTLPTSLIPAKQSNPSPVSLTPAISFLPAIADTIWNFQKKNFNDENVLGLRGIKYCIYKK